MNKHIQRTNTILYCRNWSETASFYRTILELQINHQTDWFIEFQLTDTAYISVANADRASIQSVGGQGITLSRQVAEIHTVRDFLQKKGVEVTDMKKKWGAWLFYFLDPEGHRIELWQPIAD